MQKLAKGLNFGECFAFYRIGKDLYRGCEGWRWDKVNDNSVLTRERRLGEQIIGLLNLIFSLLRSTHAA